MTYHEHIADLTGWLETPLPNTEIPIGLILGVVILFYIVSTARQS